MRLQHRWTTNVSLLASYATMLDPRTKALKYCTPEDRIGMWNSLVDAAELLHLDMIQKQVMQEQYPPTNQTPQQTPQDVFTPQDPDVDDFFASMDGFRMAAFESAEEARQLQIRRFRGEVQAEVISWQTIPAIKTKEDPLAVWQQHHKSFPRLALLARQVLAIQASSVASERVASTAGNIVTAKRARLTPQRVSMFTFARSNWHLVEKDVQIRRDKTRAGLLQMGGVAFQYFESVDELEEEQKEFEE